MDTSGCFVAALPEPPGAEDHQAARRTAQGRRGRPAPRLALRDRQQRRRQAHGQPGGPEPVDGSRRAAGPRGHDEHHDRDDDEREPRRQPEDAVIAGVATHQQAHHDESGPAAEAQRPRQHRHRRHHPVLGQLLAQDRDADRVQRVRRCLQYPGDDQQRQRRGGGGKNRAEQHDGEHDQQHVLLAVQVGQPADQRGGSGRGEKIRGDRPAGRDRRRVQLMGDDAEHRNDGGLQHGDGQDHHGQAGDQQPGSYLAAEAGPRRFGLDHGPLRSLAHLRFFRLCPLAQKRQQPLMRKRRRAVPVAADHVVVDDQRVEHRLLDGLHGRGVEIVHAAPRHECERAELVVTGWPDGKRTRKAGHIRGGEGQEDVAGEVAARRAGSGQAQAERAAPEPCTGPAAAVRRWPRSR